MSGITSARLQAISANPDSLANNQLLIDNLQFESVVSIPLTDVTTSTAAVPEPLTILGTLIAGGLGVGVKRKLKKN